jgi:hypothetical protein
LTGAATQSFADETNGGGAGDLSIVCTAAAVETAFPLVGNGGAGVAWAAAASKIARQISKMRRGFGIGFWLPL